MCILPLPPQAPLLLYYPALVHSFLTVSIGVLQIAKPLFSMTKDLIEVLYQVKFFILLT